MTEVQQKAAARQFVKDWLGHGDEKQETQRFWMALLQKVYGVEEPDKAIAFEVRVKLDHTSFIDGYIKDTHVLIEQKGMDIDLKKGYKQSDGSLLTPFQQARRYAGYLPHNMNPRWVVVCAPFGNHLSISKLHFQRKKYVPTWDIFRNQT